MEDRLQEIETRKAELRDEINAAESVEKVEELKQEVEDLKNEETEVKEVIEAEKSVEEARKVAQNLEERDSKEGLKEIKMEEKSMEEKMELRNSKKYVDAYAEYVKTGKDEELRSLLTTNASENGSIAVPDFVYDEVKTAWEKSDILSLVRRNNIKGNLKVQFEISGSAAVIHAEGEDAVAEEELVEGIITLTPVSIKKWISVSDEVMDMRGEAFLRYIYDELTYRIAKKAVDTLIGKIAALPTSATSSSASANKVVSAPAVGTIATAIANLSDEAENPVIIMNKLTYADFKAAQYDGNFNVDPFEGLRVLFNNSLPAYSAANGNAVYAIVGDLGIGALANFPEGEDITIKVDELSRKKEDLVEILGREYVALGVVADKAFVNIVKPASI